ncbi:T9SS type A sorting domain-containing protein [Thermoflavifilum thermophilum]|uniref:Por secretion system C-terminal sorting domain-containing protein n=1 Tax=Thermoflavifilum thermophilum TaxID=1393122 RepID=A0A1I7NF45_9BACT|nr:T9SS type A sorting domain-containing protein [Thermoflavifilum thermophilum]SFV33281.1 Por secretion system C-terminal sorting domain-containing protein [Thermoflavifilum thermophilum]
MHKCLPLIFLLSFPLLASAQTVDVFTAVQNGGWNTASTWSPSGPPQPQSTNDKVKVIIPSGITVNTLDLIYPSQEMITRIDTIIIQGTLQLGNPNLDTSTDFFFDFPVYMVVENGGRLVDSTTASSNYGNGSSVTPRHVIALQKGQYNPSTGYDTSAIVIMPGGKFVGQCSDTSYPGTYVYGCSGGYANANWQYYGYTDICNLTLDSTKTNIISVYYLNGNINLPVILVNFSGYYQAGLGVQLQWSTSSEYNSSYFAVERSADGTSFTELGRVQAQGNSQIPHQYAFTDATVLKNAAPVYYYRLREVDLDGQFTYSKVIAIQIPQTGQPAGDLLLWPNPNTGSFQLQIPMGDNQKAMLRIVNLSGQVVQQQWVNSPTVSIQLRQAASGVYLVQVQYPDGTRKTLRMLVVR